MRAMLGRHGCVSVAAMILYETALTDILSNLSTWSRRAVVRMKKYERFGNTVAGVRLSCWSAKMLHKDES